MPGDAVSEVILGQVLTAGCGPEPGAPGGHQGRPAARRCPALTINKVCGSGLKAVMLAAQAIKCGDAEIVIAGGQESMSAAPHVLLGSRDGQRMGDWKLVDSMIVDGLWDVYNQYHMGTTAENVAKKYGITREQQDALALASQQKAAAAQEAGQFKDEIVPVEHRAEEGRPDRLRQPTSSSTARPAPKAWPACARRSTRPARVTAGNASGLNDGAAAVMVMSAQQGRGARPDSRWRAIARLRHGRARPGDHGHGPGAGLAAVR